MHIPFVIFVLSLLVEYKIVHSYAYKRGKLHADKNAKSDGYDIGREDMKNEIYQMLKLPDDELLERVNEIREKIKNKPD